MSTDTGNEALRAQFEKLAIKKLGPITKRLDGEYFGKDVRLAFEFYAAGAADARRAMTQQKEPRKKRKKVVRKSKKIQEKDDGPRYKCMVCEYDPCICSSVGTWNRGF